MPKATYYWSNSDIAQLRRLHGAGETIDAIAQNMHRTVSAVRQRLYRMDLACTRPAAAVGTQTAEQIVEKVGEEHWKRIALQREKELRKMAEEKAATDQLVDAAAALAPKSYKTAPSKCRKVAEKDSTHHSALLLLSDQHIGKVTTPGQTLGFGGYNFDRFCRRMNRLEDTVKSIVTDHTRGQVDELVIAMLGDSIDGALTHGAEAAQINTLMSQFYAGSHVTAQFLRNLSPTFPSIRVVSCVGNHPRWQNQHKMPTKNRYSNLDMFFYAYTRALVRDVANIQWTLGTQPMEQFDIRGWPFYAFHGDVLRGGDRALGIPAHAIARFISTAAQLSGRRGELPPAYYLTGHLHRIMDLPHGNGAFIVNGGFPGIDEFGIAVGLTPADPQQVFSLVHEKYGLAATYKISLKHGDDTPHNYEIPGEFPIE